MITYATFSGISFKYLDDDLLGLTACSSVSDRDQGDAVFVDQIFYGRFCCCNLLLIRRRGRINHGGIEHFSSRIDNSQLASRTERRVPSKDNLACDRRLHQKLLKILSKDLDRTVLCLFGELISDLTLDGRSDQTVVGILDGRLQNRLCLRILFGDDFFLEITQDFFRRRLNF